MRSEWRSMRPDHTHYRLREIVRSWYAHTDYRRYRALVIGCAVRLSADPVLGEIYPYMDDRISAHKVTTLRKRMADKHAAEYILQLTRVNADCGRYRGMIIRDGAPAQRFLPWLPSVGTYLQVSTVVLADLIPIWTPYVEYPNRVVRMANAIYEERSFQYVYELSDALIEDGIEIPAILRHLRNGRPHFPGCWALDRIRGIL